MSSISSKNVTLGIIAVLAIFVFGSLVFYYRGFNKKGLFSTTPVYKETAKEITPEEKPPYWPIYLVRGTIKELGDNYLILEVDDKSNYLEVESGTRKALYSKELVIKKFKGVIKDEFTGFDMADWEILNLEYLRVGNRNAVRADSEKDISKEDEFKIFGVELLP